MTETEKEIFGGLLVYRSRGDHLRALEQYEKAKEAYDLGIKFHPDDVRLLVGRSQTCSLAVQPRQAFTDAEQALQKEPNNMTACNMQARALYTMTEFERSLVMNYRGFRQRKKPQYFAEGISQALETLQDCIGQNAGHVMQDSLPIIKQIERDNHNLEEHSPKKTLHKSRIPHPEFKEKLTQMEAYKRKTLSRVLAMKYLGPMADDKFFLQKLSEDERLNSANAAGSQRLKELVDEALQKLVDRQEMLRAQCPYYTIQLAEKTKSSYQDRFLRETLLKERRASNFTVKRLLKSLDICRHRRDVKELIQIADRLQTFLDTKTPRTLPDKNIYLDQMYRIVGDGYLLQHRLSFRHSDRGHRRRVAFLMGLSTGRPTSYDSVIASYPFKFQSTKEAIEKYMNLLEMCENSTQRCWIYYELAKLLIKDKNYALGKFYGKRLQKEAQECDLPCWWLNGTLVLISGEMQQGNCNEVRALIEETRPWLSRAPSEIRMFLKKCAEMAGDTVQVDERKAIEQREQSILGVMPDPERVDMSVLFKHMTVLPPGRRFSVLPQQMAGGQWHAERRRRRQPGLTVVPGSVPTLPAQPRTLVPGLQRFQSM